MDLPEKVADGWRIIGVICVGDDEVHGSRRGGTVYRGEITDLQSIAALDVDWGSESRDGED